MRLSLYTGTLRGLRAVQWLYLPLRRIQARLPVRPQAPRVRLGPGPATGVEVLRPDLPAGLAARADAVVRREFRFLSRTERLPTIDWRRRYVGHLWSYNLHYFDYARDLAWAHRTTGEARYAETFVELALSWLRGTDPGRGDGWEPYAVSLRLVNWLYALSLLGEAVPEAARREIGTGLAAQAGWLERRLEHHIQANHLQKNHFALAVAGLFFEGADADRWRAKGLEGSWRAVREQVLDDGGHYERSPMYHAIVLLDLLELAALCGAAGERVPGDVRERLVRMVRALEVLTRPDGSLHLFNDSADGIAPGRTHLDRLARQVLGEGIQDTSGLLRLPQTGYYGLHDPANGDRLLVDCGPPGPIHQPGHAQCDMLSFELDVAGRPFAVDSGVHGYGADPYREYVRSTRAHNTVAIGDREQHEVWGTFRMARRGRAFGASLEADGGAVTFRGSCRHYSDPRKVHERRIRRERPGHWEVSDRVANAPAEMLRSFLHLHPDFHVDGSGGELSAYAGGVRVRIVLRNLRLAAIHRGRTEPVQGWHCPRFGEARAAPALEMVPVSDGPFGYTLERVTVACGGPGRVHQRSEDEPATSSPASEST